MQKYFKFILISILLINSLSVLKAEEQVYRILKLVNDQVITNYDLEIRLQLFSFLNKQSLDENNIGPYADEMLKLMIDEKLQLEQINKYKIQIKGEDVDSYIKRSFLTPNQDINDFKNLLMSKGIDINILRESIKIQLGWNRLAGKLFYRSAEVTKIDIDEAMKKNLSLSEDQIKDSLIQRQITLRAEKLIRDLRLESNIETR